MHKSSDSSSALQNKEKAEKLYSLAKKIFKNDPDRAEALLQNAERLYPTREAKNLLKCIEQLRITNDQARCSKPRSNRSGSSGQGSTRPGSSRSQQDANQSTSASQSRSSAVESVQRRRLPSDKPGEQDYTMEQIEAVRRVARCRNYYEVLEVTMDATSEEIMAAYKKLVMVLHPDKNPAPGAKQATQEVNNAKETLMDSEKRRNYDMERQAETVVLAPQNNFDESMALVVMGLLTAGTGLLFMFLDNLGKRRHRNT